MQSATTRRRNPVRPQTAKIYQSYLDAHILPFLGNEPTYTIENGGMKRFVASLAGKNLSASTINQIFNVATAVLASETDPNGNEINPRTWNHDFIDLPIVNKAEVNAPIVTSEQIEALINDSDGQLQALLVLLSASGLRIGEALGLQSRYSKAQQVNSQDGSYWDPETATIHVRWTLVRGKIQKHTKTAAGNRDVDLASEVNDYLKRANLPVDGAFLFQNTLGDAARVNTLYSQIDALGLDAGFHAFRRFRTTHLRQQDIPEQLIKIWLGHDSNSDITDRYSKIGSNKEYRKSQAEKAGFGFKLGEKI